MTYRHALGNSLNLSAVRVLKSLGGESHLLRALQQLGLTTVDQPAEHYGLGLTIGNAPVRLLELTNAYACLACGGLIKKWTLFEEEVGTASTERFCSEITAWLVADILQDNTARVISFGQNSVLRLPFRAAVKTGTSTNYRDNWCIGFVPEFTVGVWAGNFAGTPMQQVIGVSGAGPIWRDVMLKLKSTHKLSWYAEPEGLERGQIDLSTGKRLNRQMPAVKFSRQEVWAKANPPALAQRTDYELKTQRSILPLECKDWIKSSDNWLGDSVTCETGNRFQELRITSPVDGMIIVAGDKLKLTAVPIDGIKWVSDTLLIREEEGHTWAVHLRPGKHVLVALRGEARAKVSFEVK
jgi:penicillin-binding protein 1C